MTGPASDTVRQAFKVQAGFCRVLGSPFSAAVLGGLAGHAAAAGPVARLLEPWRGADMDRLTADATPLRMLGGLHHLVLTGAELGLASVYPTPSSPGDLSRLPAALDAAVERHEGVLAVFMRSPPQTNEVRRALALIGGFLTVAAGTRLPLSVLEIGASAGLLQNFDRFRYEPDAWSWGDPGAGVRLPGAWRGDAPPLAAKLDVVARRACDQAPVDVHDEAQALRLQAYVWPDQFDRQDRLRAAIALAREAGTRVERADAAAWIADNTHPTIGTATVLFHSVMWQYMPADTQAAARAGLEAAGGAASDRAPFAWLRLEPSAQVNEAMEVRLTLWPGGEERLLARAHPHGAFVGWLGA